MQEWVTDDSLSSSNKSRKTLECCDKNLLMEKDFSTQKYPTTLLPVCHKFSGRPFIWGPPLVATLCSCSFSNSDAIDKSPFLFPHLVHLLWEGINRLLESSLHRILCNKRDDFLPLQVSDYVVLVELKLSRTTSECTPLVFTHDWWGNCGSKWCMEITERSNFSKKNV